MDTAPEREHLSVSWKQRIAEIGYGHAEKIDLLDQFI
jgi:hypothetical protein